MVPDGRVKSVIEKIGRKLSPRGLGCLVDTFQCASNRFDLLFARLATSRVSQTISLPI